MTDNGSGYRSTMHSRACAELGIGHLRTRPHRPRTNGKAERFIQTLLREWAYAAVYQDHRQQRHALTHWLEYYNNKRPHSALGHHAPIARLEPAD
jgi:transposase InsO family protein